MSLVRYGVRAWRYVSFRCRVWSVSSNRTGLPVLLWPDRRTIERIPIRRHVIDADGDNVAAAQLAVDRQVEQREIPFEPPICSLVLIDHTWLGRSGGLTPMSLPLFHGARRAGVSLVGRQSSFMVCLLG